MNENDKLPEPQSGGRYVRHEDNSLEQIHETKPAQGRTEASRLALEQRLAGDAGAAPAADGFLSAPHQE